MDLYGEGGPSLAQLAEQQTVVVLFHFLGQHSYLWVTGSNPVTRKKHS